VGPDAETSTLRALAGVLTGRAPPERAFAELLWACALRAEAGAIEPLVDCILSKYPNMHDKQTAVEVAAAEVLYHAVLSERVERVLLVLRHFDAGPFGGSRSHECDGIALVPVVGPDGGSTTALHTAARLEDGFIACVLLSSPRIAPPSSWFLHKGGALSMLPSEVAHYEDCERLRTKRASVIGDDGGGGGRGEKYQLTGVMVPRILRSAVGIVNAAVQRDAIAEDIIQLADLLEPRVHVGHDVFDENDDEDSDASDDDKANFMRSVRVAMVDSLFQDSAWMACLKARFARSSKSSLRHLENSNVALDIGQLLDALPTFEREAECENVAALDAAVKRKGAFGWRIPRRLNTLRKTAATILACAVPDGNRSNFHVGGGGTQWDTSMDKFPQEQAFRSFLGMHRTTPFTDVATFFAGIVAMTECILLEFSSERSADKLIARLTPTGFWDGSILTRTVAGCWAPALLAYMSYLALRRTKAWLGRREALLMHYRIAIAVYQYQFLLRLDPPDDLKCPNRNSASHQFFYSGVRFLGVFIATLAPPVRIDRHLPLEAVKLIGSVASLADFCEMGARDVVIEAAYGFALCFVMSMGLYKLNQVGPPQFESAWFQPLNLCYKVNERRF
jgi:hypothetical protein